MNNKDITVILLLFNTPEKIINNLRIYKSFNVVILDQSNDYKTKYKIKKILNNIKYYNVRKKNEGFAKGINFLVNKINTKYFLCSQPDVKISYNSIIELKKTFIRNKNCFLSLPKIKNQKKNIKFKLMSSKSIDLDTNCSYGTIFFSSKNKFKNIGMFDENFFFYWEDIDLSKRIIDNQGKILISTKAIATHKGGNSTTSGLKNLFIREVNFKFGEYLFSYKYKKLKFYKIVRQIINNFFYSFFYVLIFDKINCFKKIFQLLGIFKFLLFILKYDQKR